MHLITAAVGGSGEPKNTVPAPKSVNSGSQVRGFELRLEQLVKNKSGKGRQKNNLVWVRVKTTFRGAGKGPGKKTYDDQTFAQSVYFEAGRYVPNNKADKEKKKNNWDRVSKAELYTEVAVPPPPFTAKALNINDMSPSQLKSTIEISDHYATEIKQVTNKGRVTSLLDFSEKMQAEGDRVNVKFDELIKKVRVATTERLITFAD
jgi:hypothetical protein